MTPRTFYIGNSREKLHKALSMLSSLLIKPDDDLELVLKPHRKEKTHEQRKLFHAMCGDVGRELGYTPGQVKAMVKEYYFGTDIIKTPSGREYEIVRSSEEADRPEYSELIETLLRWAAENGVLVEDRRAA